MIRLSEDYAPPRHKEAKSIRGYQPAYANAVRRPKALRVAELALAKLGKPKGKKVALFDLALSRILMSGGTPLVETRKSFAKR